MSKLRIIAIDGPAGAGKSTIARALAGRLGLEYLDTGAMYRAVTVAALRLGLDLQDQAAVSSMTEQLTIEADDRGVRVDGDDVTDAIRSQRVTAAVGAVASNSLVRMNLRARQRAWGEVRGGGVIEGRDIGSVVFPDATLKLYLTASPRVRAERRLAESGGEVDEIERAIALRDESDSNRADGPLREADGAVLVDTTGLDIDQVLAHIEHVLSQVDTLMAQE